MLEVVGWHIFQSYQFVGCKEINICCILKLLNIIYVQLHIRAIYMIQLGTPHKLFIKYQPFFVSLTQCTSTKPRWICLQSIIFIYLIVLLILLLILITLWLFTTNNSILVHDTNHICDCYESKLGSLPLRYNHHSITWC